MSTVPNPYELLAAGDFVGAVTAYFGADEIGAALLSIWHRRDRLTPVELAVIRAVADAPQPRDDAGHAERFLERMQAARVDLTEDVR